MINGFGENLLEAPFEELKSLEELMLAGNDLIHLPDSFSSLKSLKLLVLMSNKFESLPEVVCSIQSLKELYIDGNLELIQREYYLHQDH